MQFLEKLKPLGLLVLRWAVGASFLYHGYPKLSDPARWLKAFPAMGFPSYFAYISGILEVFGGGLLILGLFTRGAALLLAIEMGLVVGRTKLPAIVINVTTIRTMPGSASKYSAKPPHTPPIFESVDERIRRLGPTRRAAATSA